MPNRMQKEPIRKFPLHGQTIVTGGRRGSVSAQWEQHLRHKEEDERLRRLSNVRSVVNPARKSISPPRVPRATLKEPPLPQLSTCQSVPNLQEFASRTHLARLDASYEKLDTYVEQSVSQLQSSVRERIDKLKEWVEAKIGTTEEKLAEALSIVQSTRSVLDNAVSSLSAAQGGKNDELRARVASCEERLLAIATNSVEMRERIAALDERWGKEIFGDSPKALAERLRIIELHFGNDFLQEATPKALGDRIRMLELHVGLEMHSEASPKALTGDELCLRSRSLDERLKVVEKECLAERALPPKAEGAGLSSELETRLKCLEEQVQSNLTLTEKVDQASRNAQECKAALEFAVGDLAERFSDQSLTKDMHGSISDARYEGLQNAFGELRSEMEAARLERASMKIDFADQIAWLEKKSGQDSLDTIAQRLQIAFGEKLVFKDRVSTVEEKNVLGAKGLSTLETKVFSNDIRLSVLSDNVVSEKMSLSSLGIFNIMISHALSIRAEEIIELKSLHDDKLTDLGSQAESWIESLGQQFIDQLKNQAGADRDKYYASVIVFKEDYEKYGDREEQFSIAMSHAMSITIEEISELSALHGNTFVDLGLQAEVWIASLGQQFIDQLKSNAETDQDKYYASVIVFKQDIEKLKDGSDIAKLSEESQLKPFEKLLSMMALSISSLQQISAGGNISDLRIRMEAGFNALLVRMESARFLSEQQDQAADFIFQRFVSGMDQRIKLIEAQLNKNNHWTERLMAKSGLKVKALHYKGHCDCGAEYDPDFEVCHNCGEPWKAHIHDELRKRAAGIRLKKHVKDWMSGKETECKVKLLYVAFDVWARGEHAISFKTFAETHPRDRRDNIPVHAVEVHTANHVEGATGCRVKSQAPSLAGSGKSAHSLVGENLLSSLSPAKDSAKKKFLTNPFSSSRQA